jgi:glycosyltransferase involved in cell wall biosynthesis
MISVVVLTQNEEKNIADCLHSLSWCDEIVIIDDYSTDATEQVISSLSLKQVHVYKHHLNGNFSDARNFGLEKARHEWVLFIDADERISSSLQYEIVSSITSSIENYTGYYLKRTDVMWGKELRFGEVGNIALLRLAKKGSGKWTGHVHERWQVKGKTTKLKKALLHYPHQNVTEFLREINYYTDIRAEELYKLKKKTSLLAIAAYPLAKFLQNYIFKQGFRDGVRGMILALMMSFHSFLVRGKLWQLWQKNA